MDYGPAERFIREYQDAAEKQRWARDFGDPDEPMTRRESVFLGSPEQERRHKNGKQNGVLDLFTLDALLSKHFRTHPALVYGEDYFAVPDTLPVDMDVLEADLEADPPDTWGEWEAKLHEHKHDRIRTNKIEHIFESHMPEVREWLTARIEGGEEAAA